MNRRLGRRGGTQVRHIQWLTAAVAAGGMFAPQVQLTASAATDNWIAGSSNWSNPANWSGDKVPGNFDTVLINDNDSVDRTITYDYTSSQVTLTTLAIVNTGGGTNTLAVGASSQAVTSYFLLVGASGTTSTLSGAGVLTQSGGVDQVAYDIYLGENANDNGVYNLQSGELIGGIGAGEFANLYVGYSGEGTVNQSGGAIQTSGTGAGMNVYVGYNATGVGNYNMTGGELLIGGLIVGDNGVGHFTQSGGVVQSIATQEGDNPGPISIGNGSGSIGTYDLLTGSLVEPVNNNNSGPTLYVGEGDGSTGSLTLGTGDPSLDAGLYMAVGYGGTGSFVQQSGTTETGMLSVGGEPIFDVTNTASGTVNISGGDLTILGWNWVIGSNDGATGSVTVSGGEVAFLGELTINQEFEGETGLVVGAAQGATGSFTLSGGSIENSNGRMIVGSGGTGTFSQLAGTNFVGTLFIGGAQGGGVPGGGNGSYLLQGGALNVGSQEVIGAFGVGSLAQSGGSNVAGTLSVGGDQFYGNNNAEGIFSLSGGTLTVPGLEVIAGYGESTGTFIQSGGINTVGTLLIGGFPSGQIGGFGSYLLAGGTLSVAGTESVANASTGSMVQSGGNNTAAALVVGYQNQYGRASYTLSGAGTLTTDAEYVGDEASGTFVQTGGSNTLLGTSGNLDIGVYDLGTYLLSGGILSVGGQIDIGSERGDSLSIADGVATAGSLFNTGTLSITNDGSLTLAGPFTQNFQGTLVLGLQSLTAFNQILADGTITLAGLLTLDLGTGYSPQLGDTFPILVDADGVVAGTFSSLQVNGFYNGGHFAVEYNPAGNPRGVDVEFVPEPGCGALLLAGASAAFGRCKRHVTGRQGERMTR
jgi:hypothetical protein